MPPFSFGWIRQATDSRDRRFFSPRRVTAILPPVFSLRSKMGPMLNQGGLGSCSANTTAEIITHDQIVQGLPVYTPSRLFIYYNTRRLMGTVGQDSGADNRSMMKALAKWGFCDETLWPYSDDRQTFIKQPTPAAYAAAVQNKIVAYSAVDVLEDQIKGAIYTGNPIVFGFEVFRGIIGDQAAQTGVVPMPAAGESAIGGHDVSLIGYDSVNKLYEFQNHWQNAPGHPWGDHGFGWIPESYAHNTNWCGDLWVINAVPGTPPQPPAPPAPPTPPPPAPPTTGTSITFSGKLTSGEVGAYRVG